ncbi:proline dehydrogenase [Corallococcus sp. H22C18031201]|uniref:proline dehydrogenase family protein n=1 Tax=Citreicoccus inhibens TaxID=2849499 RepID=UPI000E749EE1|nr:proline dehydrogenase family protein [Citreicoccus inhibens]MBU8897300.1 proline dehydrogenase family protein [Citreicoccus inhibens]RJS21140.1 proline dehydrogenase [Corallococcus sp. H22C18031201]
MTAHALPRATLLFLSRRQRLKGAALKLRPLRELARRFVAGETWEDAVDTARALAEQGLRASVDHLNEAVRSEAEAHEEVVEYKRLLRRIDESGVKAHVSLKLTQCGLLLSPALALANAREVVAEATARDSFVRVDMEHAAVTQVTLDIVRALRAESGETHVGAVLQSALRRTEADARALCAEGVRIRLCKGAYLERSDVAFPDKADVDANFVRCMRVLLDSGVRHGIATHDERMIDATRAHAEARGLPKDAFEFQMLLGIRRDLQLALALEGHPVRVYVPYGRAWYPYLMRRLAERPANLRFLWHQLWRG